MSYTLDFLERAFAEHSKRYKIQLEEQEKKREENGWEKLDYDYGFNLAEALFTITKAIQELKNNAKDI